MVNKADKNQARLKRHRRVRGKIFGTAARPRLNVFRSRSNMNVQIIDDVTATTLVSASTYEKDFNSYGGNKAAALELGKIIAKRALEKGIKTVVFDRGGYLFHGRVKSLADGAREAGLEF